MVASSLQGKCIVFSPLHHLKLKLKIRDCNNDSEPFKPFLLANLLSCEQDAEVLHR